MPVLVLIGCPHLAVFVLCLIGIFLGDLVAADGTGLLLRSFCHAGCRYKDGSFSERVLGVAVHMILCQDMAAGVLMPVVGLVLCPGGVEVMRSALLGYDLGLCFFAAFMLTGIADFSIDPAGCFLRYLPAVPFVKMIAFSLCRITALTLAFVGDFSIFRLGSSLCYLTLIPIMPEGIGLNGLLSLAELTGKEALALFRAGCGFCLLAVAEYVI